MNPRQRSKRYADAVTDLQRLYKQVRGAPDAAYVLMAVKNLAAARDQAAAQGGGRDVSEAEEEEEDLVTHHFFGKLPPQDPA